VIQLVKFTATKQEECYNPCGSEIPVVKEPVLLFAHRTQILEC